MPDDAKAVEACKAALEALRYYTLCDEQDVGKDENDETAFGLVAAVMAQEKLVKQLAEAVGDA